jgi:hypothetical protein
MVKFKACSARTFIFQVTEHAQVKEATLSFQAYGLFPLQALSFTFRDPNGKSIADIRPKQGLAYEEDWVKWMRKHVFGLRMEYRVRKTIRQLVYYTLDVPLACFADKQVAVEISNSGYFPLLVGSVSLNRSTLDPDRTVRNEHGLEGYSDKISVYPGQTIAFCVHSPHTHFSLEVIRFGEKEESLLRRDNIPGRVQHYKQNAYKCGADWETSYTLQIPDHWRSGMYAGKLADETGQQFYMTFVVKTKRADKPASVAVLASTNTWQAYNEWGGASLYRYDVPDSLHRARSQFVHMLRPNPGATPIGNSGHLACAEKHVLSWLEHHGIGYDLYADWDLHQEPELLRKHRVLLLNTHNEYWSHAMYWGLEDYLAGGGNLLYLSGNGLYWKTVINGDQLEVRQDHGNHTLSDEAGGQWRNYGRPETKILGIRFTNAGYSSFKPYKVISPHHWIFADTEVKKGDLIGAQGLNTGGASGWELDKINPYATPPGLVHLAKGTNRWRNGADMIYFEQAGGGGIFSVGSITFGGSLVIDPVLSKMMQNVIATFLADPAKFEAVSATSGTHKSVALDAPGAPGVCADITDGDEQNTVRRRSHPSSRAKSLPLNL